MYNWAAARAMGGTFLLRIEDTDQARSTDASLQIILAGLRWIGSNRPEARFMVSVASDAPFFPADLVARLVAGAEAAGTPLACAMSYGRTHPVFGLWPVSLADDLEHALRVEDLRKVDAWTGRYGCAAVAFAETGFDPFFNVNRPEDLAAAEEMLARTPV
jgi:molybdopterin-guanine dinucleotide biosynthesis protein A